MAAVAVLSEYSGLPAVFGVQSENIPQLRSAEQESRLALTWQRQTVAEADRLRATIQRKPLIELAATAVALVMANRVCGLERFDVTTYGERADFRGPHRRFQQLQSVPIVRLERRIGALTDAELQLVRSKLADLLRLTPSAA